ncbi:MAG: amidohydrolase [Xanthomonadales bacterium]|nr:amidohydrolase [Xanthomonadales bacterium]
MNNTSKLLIRLLGLLALCASTLGQAATTGELLIFGGPIYTMAANQPEVAAVVVADGRVLFAGSREDAQAWAGSDTRMLDLAGNTMIPGFIESHGHIMSFGYSLRELDLSGAKTYSDIVAQVAAAVATAEPGEWIIGNSWHQSKWTSPPPVEVKGFQTHGLLSEVSPDNPVLLNHASGHALMVNARAMQIAGINADTVVPEGGEIIKDANGEATGLLTENAMDLAYRALPVKTAADNQQALGLALNELARNGITSFQDAGSTQADIDAYRALYAQGKLSSRLWVMLAGWDQSLLAEWLKKGPEIDADHDFLTIRAIKLVADGALGSRGAWLLQPYSDRPDWSGSASIPMETVLTVAREALQAGFQLCVHAIGDRANREVLDQFETAFHGQHSDARFRIEHAQHLSAQDIARFAQLGVIASMQGIHLSSDRPWAIDRLGIARIEEGTYVWRKLLDSGAIIINGTDVPVEPVNPIASFYALVTRKTLAGLPENGYEPSQKLTRPEALRAYTLNAAYGAFEENIKGSIEAGKLADFTILSRDIMTVPENELLAVQIEQTIVGGNTIYLRHHK